MANHIGCHVKRMPLISACSVMPLKLRALASTVTLMGFAGPIYTTGGPNELKAALQPQVTRLNAMNFGDGLLSNPRRATDVSALRNGRAQPPAFHPYEIQMH